MIGRARNFNGTADYIDLAGTATGKLSFPASGTYSISVWQYARDTLNRYIVSKGDGHYAMYYRTAGPLAMVEVNSSNTGGRQYAQTPGWGMQGRWAHVRESVTAQICTCM